MLDPLRDRDVDLQGKIALVTGAAHRLGRAIAVGLADRGCDVAVHYHASQEQAASTAAEIRSKGVRAIILQADLGNWPETRRLFGQFDREFDHLDVLVNSAAVMQPVGLLEATESDWQRTIDLNLKGAFFCLQEAARRMRTQGGGVIVNISDLAGRRPWLRFPIHSISKAGMEMLTQVAALALAPDIRVNAVAPGPVLRPTAMSIERWNRMGAALPTARPGQPEDVVRSVLFLLENEFITGETMAVDGGGQLA
jgi:NAD(P)-dependent dehydrogenase (short-subunit alcohol dehydrogenase family)